MILPDKHITFAESLIGLGSFILDNLTSPKNIDLLWHDFEKIRTKEYPAYHSFDNLVLAINMLYTLKMIEISSGDLLMRVKSNEIN